MTAEIAILNSKAVALAADSAVTINYGEKVYHSVDKLFELSHHHPVGIMFYGRDNFLGIPWETIIKMYREQLQNKSFHTVEQYAENFFLFLQDVKFDVTKDEKREMLFILEALHIEIAVIYKQFSEIKHETISEGNELLPHDAKIKQFNTQIERYLINRIENLPNNYVANFSDEDYYFLLETYSAYIEKIIQENFSKDMFKESWFKTIKAIVCLTLLKKFNKYKSGIVFAGFGEKEWLPSVVAYEVEGKINGKIKYRLIKEKTRSINEQVNASIIPFAQVDMVDAFITGIDNKLETFYLSEIERFITNVSREAIKFLTNQFKEKEKFERIENKLFNELAKMYRIFNETITSFKEKQYIDPIIYSVQVLPKMELAEMAETLVNLTSFKRKVSSTV